MHLGAPFACGGGYGRRKRSTRLSQLKRRLGKENNDDLRQKLISLEEGIDNEAFENGNLAI